MDGEQFTGLKDIWKTKTDAQPAVLTKELLDAFFDQMRHDLFEEPQDDCLVMGPGEYIYWKHKLEEGYLP